MSRPKHFLYRAALVQWIDSLFYEAGNSKRTHIRAYKQFVRPISGIGKETFRSYLHWPAEELAGHEPPEDLKFMMMLYVSVRKTLSAAESARFLQHLAECTILAEEAARGDDANVTADKLIEYLYSNPKQMKE